MTQDKKSSIEEDPVAYSYALTAEALRKGRKSADFRENENYAKSKFEDIFKDAYTATDVRKKQRVSY